MLNVDTIFDLIENIRDSKEDDYSKKLKEKIIEFVKNFKDLKKEEVIKINGWTQHISRSENVINFKPPYNTDEVNSFEERNNIKLPEELKTYLTEISKSIFYKHDELRTEQFFIINLENNENLSKTCSLKHRIQFKPELNINYSDDDDHPLLNCHGMMYLRYVGCGYTDQIVLNGRFEGSVVNESFVGDGPIKIINRSFYKYICNTALINTED